MTMSNISSREKMINFGRPLSISPITTIKTEILEEKVKTDGEVLSENLIDDSGKITAIALNIDISSVYKSRYRLRKKLHITSDTDLDAFLKAF